MVRGYGSFEFGVLQELGSTFPLATFPSNIAPILDPTVSITRTCLALNRVPAELLRRHRIYRGPP